jgi:hypothetical protein
MVTLNAIRTVNIACFTIFAPDEFTEVGLGIYLFLKSLRSAFAF